MIWQNNELTIKMPFWSCQLWISTTSLKVRMSMTYQQEIPDVARVNLPKDDLSQIGEIHVTQLDMVNFIVWLSDPLLLPMRMQIAVKARFEPAVCEDTVVLVEPTHDLLEKHSVCLSKVLVPLAPEADEEQIIMANIMDQDVWLGCQMTELSCFDRRLCDPWDGCRRPDSG